MGTGKHNQAGTQVSTAQLVLSMPASERTGVSQLVARRHLTNWASSDRGEISWGPRAKKAWALCMYPGPDWCTPPWITHSTQLNSHESSWGDQQSICLHSLGCLHAYTHSHSTPTTQSDLLKTRGTEVHRWNSNPAQTSTPHCSDAEELVLKVRISQGEPTNGKCRDCAKCVYEPKLKDIRKGNLKMKKLVQSVCTHSMTFKGHKTLRLQTRGSRDRSFLNQPHLQLSYKAQSEFPPSLQISIYKFQYGKVCLYLLWEWVVIHAGGFYSWNACWDGLPVSLNKNEWNIFKISSYWLHPNNFLRSY